MKILRVLIAASACFISFNIFAWHSFLNVPRVYLEGSAGSGLVGQGDLLQPVYMDKTQNYFVYGNARVANEESADLKTPCDTNFGAGGRRIFDIYGYQSVLGANALMEYSRTSTSHDVWSFVPGIESLGRVYDFYINGYFPISKKRWTTTAWAEDEGIFKYLRYTGHNTYDALLTYYEETGPGFDLKADRNIYNYKGTNFKLGGVFYYYNMKNNDDIFGGGAELTVQPTSYMKIKFNDTYDNYNHNQFMMGVQLSVYDLFAANKAYDPKDLIAKLDDPIEHHFATIATVASNITEGDPKVGSEGLKNNNTWFFSTDVTAVSNAGDEADGTFEHQLPAEKAFDQTEINIAETDYNPATAIGKYIKFQIQDGKNIITEIGGKTKQKYIEYKYPFYYEGKSTANPDKVVSFHLYNTKMNIKNDMRLENVSLTNDYTKELVFDTNSSADDYFIKLYGNAHTLTLAKNVTLTNIDYWRYFFAKNMNAVCIYLNRNEYARDGNTLNIGLPKEEIPKNSKYYEDSNINISNIINFSLGDDIANKSNQSEYFIESYAIRAMYFNNININTNGNTIDAEAVGSAYWEEPIGDIKIYDHAVNLETSQIKTTGNKKYTNTIRANIDDLGFEAKVAEARGINTYAIGNDLTATTDYTGIDIRNIRFEIGSFEKTVPDDIPGKSPLVIEDDHENKSAGIYFRRIEELDIPDFGGFSNYEYDNLETLKKKLNVKNCSFHILNTNANNEKRNTYGIYLDIVNGERGIIPIVEPAPGFEVKVATRKAKSNEISHCIDGNSFYYGEGNSNPITDNEIKVGSSEVGFDVFLEGEIPIYNKPII